jgi:hypothetical protein
MFYFLILEKIVLFLIDLILFNLKYKVTYKIKIKSITLLTRFNLFYFIA